MHFSLQDRQKHTAFTHKYIALNKHCPWYLIFTACVCRDLIRVLKWYVDRIIDAEHQEQIQQVLKVRRLTYYTSFWMYVTVCMQIYEETYAPNLSLSPIMLGLTLTPCWSSELPPQQLWIPLIHLFYPLQPLSPTEVLFLPIMQLSYKHSVFSLFIRLAYFHDLPWDHQAHSPNASTLVYTLQRCYLKAIPLSYLEPFKPLWAQCVPFIFSCFALSNWKKEENALHTMSPGLTFLPSFLPIYIFIYLKIKNCK